MLKKHTVSTLQNQNLVNQVIKVFFCCEVSEECLFSVFPHLFKLRFMMKQDGLQLIDFALPYENGKTAPVGSQRHDPVITYYHRGNPGFHRFKKAYAGCSGTTRTESKFRPDQNGTVLLLTLKFPGTFVGK